MLMSLHLQLKPIESRKTSPIINSIFSAAWMTILVGFLSCGLGTGARVVVAQESGSSSPAKEGDLTRELLELLKEPAVEKSSSPPSNVVDSNGSSIPTSDSLVEVQLDMSTAAGWLRGREPLKKTEGLQNDILARLDQLIEEIEKQSPTSSGSSARNQTPKGQDTSMVPSKNQKTSSTQRETNSSDNTRRPGDQREVQNGNQATKARNVDDGDPSENSPEQAGSPSPGPLQKRGPVAVDLRDPEALQRSAWGSLPDRVREQMQSRMVERFLPAYREEIEAYYRALAK